MHLVAVLLVVVSAIVTSLVTVLLVSCLLKRLVTIFCKTQKTQTNIDAESQQSISIRNEEEIRIQQLTPPPSYEEIMSGTQHIYVISTTVPCYSYTVDDDLLPTYDQVAAGYHHYSHSQQQK